MTGKDAPDKWAPLGVPANRVIEKAGQSLTARRDQDNRPDKPKKPKQQRRAK